MEEIYVNDFIRNFIIRFDFNEIDECVFEELQSTLEKDFGFVINETTVIENKQINVDTKTDKAEIKSTGAIKQYQMLNAERNIKVTFNKNVFIYETLKYRGFDNIKNIIDYFITIAIKGKLMLFNRIGMRYINNIELPSNKKEDIFEWKGYVAEDILTNTQFIPKNKTLQSILVNDFKSSKNDNILFKLQTGIPNPNKPADIIKKVFLIDIDGYVITEETRSAMQRLSEIHVEEKEIFEKCIDEKLREKMRGDSANG